MKEGSMSIAPAQQSLSPLPAPARRIPLTPRQQAVVTHAAKLIAADESEGELPGYLRLLDELLAIIDDVTGHGEDGVLSLLDGDKCAGENEIRSTRQAGWFMCRSGGRSMQHFTTDGGHSAVCNKSFTARYAPLNDGTGWGFEITAEVDPETTIFTLCPRCVVKREAL
jgi:hypothetical protein